MVKNLSVIGNSIENKVDKKWLKENGFGNVIGVNEVKDIGRDFVDRDKVFSF